ncbi:MAG TPA: helix-turn-helix domain-containing protein [Caldilineaceae bacterium]|nr:helix-turn-helix domain-containing protein [Caldilineaceae bacterium]
MGPSLELSSSQPPLPESPAPPGQMAARRQRTLMLYTDQEHRESSVAAIKALGSTQRLRILAYLQDRVANVTEIAEALAMPLSTTVLHLSTLERAGLVRVETVAASRGVQKLCARIFDMIVVVLPQQRPLWGKTISHQMPVGAYSDCQITPTCGLAGSTGIIGLLDDPASFYEPARLQAQLIWFHSGYVEYRFPLRLSPELAVTSLQISAELCSEAPLHHDEWPSDIYLEINGRRLGVWTAPGDFGDRRGNLTPEWWEDWNSQYGLLKVWRVDADGSWLDDAPLSDVRLSDLALDQQPFVRVRFGVDPQGEHVGGVNLFGRGFGNYPQDILFQVHYQ